MAHLIGRGFLATALRGAQLPEGEFYFSGVSSNSLITEEAIRRQLEEWIKLLTLCKLKKHYLVYASSALAGNPQTPYGKLKRAMELLVEVYGVEALGLRLPAVYGPGEEHKGKAASVVYQFCQQLKKGEAPEILGDGNQTRDFLYIDDAINTITRFAQNHLTGVMSIGTGIETSFNDVVATINRALGTTIVPVYLPRPAQYTAHMDCTPVSYRVSLEEGIKRILHDTKL